MDVFSVILFVNLCFLISSFLFQNIFLSLIISFSIFFILIFLITNNIIKLRQGRFDLGKRIYEIRPRFSRKNYLTFLICMGLFIIFRPYLSFNGALFTSFFLFARLNNLDNRSAFFMAFVFLFVTLFQAYAPDQHPAEISLITAFYFLTVGVIWEIIDQKRKKYEKSN